MAAYLPDTPPAAGRAWVPGCRARTFRRSVTPFYDETPPCGSPWRDRFVISIGNAGLMYPITGLVGPGRRMAAHRLLIVPVQLIPAALRHLKSAQREKFGAETG